MSGHLPIPWLAGGILLLLVVRRLALHHPRTRPASGAAAALAAGLLLEIVRRLGVGEGWGGIEPFLLLGALSLSALGLILILGWVVYDLLLLRRRDRTATRIMKDLTTVALATASVLLLTRQIFQVNLASLIATSAVVSLIVGLALQETLSSVFAGLALQVERPYEPGDWITYDGFMGRVEEVNWRSTRLLTLENDTVVVPNHLMARGNILNHGRDGHPTVRRLTVGVSYGVPPNRVRQILMGILTGDPGVSGTPPPQVHLAEYGDFAITYQLRFAVTDFGSHLVIQDRILTRVWYAFHRHRVTIPYPIRDVRLHRPSHDREREEATGERERIREILAGVEILSPLSPGELDRLAHRVRMHHVAGGETVIRQGEPGDSCFIILSGSARVSVTTPAGERSVATLGAGQVFGEISLVTGEPRSATVTALTDMELVVVTSRVFAGILAADPEIARGISRILATRREETWQRVNEAGPGEVPGEEDDSQLLGRIRRFFGL
jgi:small-conductance mechanosensitive channel